MIIKAHIEREAVLDIDIPEGVRFEDVKEKLHRVRVAKNESNPKVYIQDGDGRGHNVTVTLVGESTHGTIGTVSGIKVVIDGREYPV